MKRDNLKLILPWIGFALFVLAAIYMTIQDNKPGPSIKNESNGAEMVYFNSKIHKFDTTYSSVITYDDSLVNFTSPGGKIWAPKDFINEKDNYDQDEDNNNYVSSRDITVSSGERFIITILSDNACATKSQMDSIKNQ